MLFRSNGIKLIGYPLLFGILYGIACSLSFIPLIIIKRRTKNETIIINNHQKMININDKNEITKGKWKYILLFNILFSADNVTITYSLFLKSNLSFVSIIITSIICKYVFRLNIYKHHYLCLCIILIILAEFITALVTQDLQNDVTNHIFSFLMRIIREITPSIHVIINKYLMEKKFCSVYLLTTCNGIIVTSLFGIFSILDYYYFKLDNFQEYFDNFNYKEFLVIIGFMIIQLGFYLSLMFTNKHNTPCHLFIIFTFGELVNNINLSIASLITIICFIFIMFISLVFNEIIEINCCGLELNTKRNIIKRALDEEFNMIHNNILHQPSLLPNCS